MIGADPLATLPTDFGRWSTDPNRPDYACDAYRDMAPRWQLVNDIRGGTFPIREKKAHYLPRFEAESQHDWQTRVAMTFVADHYAATIAEHVGLVLATPPKLGEDVPQPIMELVEDIDGEGNHLDVFAHATLDAALHFGHAVLFTDYPPVASTATLQDARQAKARPYVTLYAAPDVLSWRWATVGGVRVLVQIVFRETTSVATGAFGVAEATVLREITQDVFYDEVTGRATGLGAITWRTYRLTDRADGATAAEPEFVVTGEGVITGPTRICARVVYGGERCGVLHTKPHLMGLAFSNIEETQVASDYANVMHKCNVPTPIFIGRAPAVDGASQTIQMGQGIDIPIGGDAKIMEPAGTAIGATRDRLNDLQARMRRQGATNDDATGKTMTAAEAQLHAKQRNAKLARAARSLQDALEGVFADFAAFMGLAGTAAVKSGGSLTINQDYAGAGGDPAIAALIWSAVAAGEMPIEAFTTYIQSGALPDDIQQQIDALRFMKAAEAADAAALAAEMAPVPPALPVAA